LAQESFGSKVGPLCLPLTADNMGCGQTKTANKSQAAQVDAKEQQPAPTESVMEQSPEEKALTQLKLIFKDMDLNGDDTVNKEEFTAALKRNDKLSGLLKEANMNNIEGMPAVDTNKDGLITWVEFESYLKGALSPDAQNAQKLQEKLEDAAEIPAKEKAHQQLKTVFDSLKSDDSDKNDDSIKVNAEQLADALKKDNGLVDLLVKAEFNHDIGVLCQFDADGDGLVSWQEFVTRLEASAKKEIKCTGELAAAATVEVQIDDKPEERATGCSMFC